MDDQVDSLTSFVPPEHHTRDIALRSPVHSSVDRRRRSQQQHSGDYSDLDEQRSLAHAGPTSQDYRYDRSPLSISRGQQIHPSRASPSLSRNESHVGEFVEGLGPGQLVGRQVLGMPCLGEIQLSFFDRKGHLEVEVIRARGLQHKNSAKPIPAPYVKLHLLEGKQSVEKIRTTTPPRRTLDPLYQQQLTFSMPYHGRIIQMDQPNYFGRLYGISAKDTPAVQSKLDKIPATTNGLRHSFDV
ncbi:uncharacterized protein DEA37_0006556 [Paragonimus westermani]|uniref:C2 domain-containing protein n=1 Tax=Paragonimus westermani TaxID=34504 RepID=A0A5J4NKD1_9TREM|nr:uncharacterized protein DEA37_0006556 [Paragonimus westermani]